jgi:hypothetical protein
MKRILKRDELAEAITPPAIIRFHSFLEMLIITPYTKN